MGNWNRGYVADIDYLSGFYANHAPAYLDFVRAAAGMAPTAPKEDFTWCELGCGTGFTANLLAATHPAAYFHAIDMAEGHIRAARRLAEAAGLDNIRFHQAEFGTVDQALPAFDYIVAHGVYSWVAPEVQRSIVAFLANHLKPGGTALLSYNVVPGWLEIVPLQRLLIAHARTSDGDSVARFKAAMAFARTLKAAGAATIEKIDIDAIATPPPGRSPRDHDAYLAHEYLNAHWQPLLHSDVVQDLAPVGLTFAGSATIAGLKGPSLTDAQHAVAETIEDPVLRESFFDYCGRNAFRSDVFVRSADKPSPEQAEKQARNVLVAATGGLAVPGGSADSAGLPGLDTEAQRIIASALEQRVYSIEELLALPALQGREDLPGASVLARTLVASEQVIPVRRREPQQAAVSSDRFNRVQMTETADRPGGRLALATPLGNGILLGEPDASLFQALATGPSSDPATILQRVVDKFHDATRGTETDHASDAGEYLRRGTAEVAAAAFRSLPGMLQRLGLRTEPAPQVSAHELERAMATIAPLIPDLPTFDSDLFIPEYRPIRKEDWELRIAGFVLSPGYWSPPRLVTNMAALVRKGETWMSITPMELESQEIGIRLARGHVAIFGMGLGWAAAATAAQPAVERVTVVERDPAVIAIIEELGILEQLPDAARAKIVVKQGDAFAWRPASHVDLLMPDIWLPLMHDSRLDEVRRMQEQVRASAIYFWGQEMELARHAAFKGRPFDKDGLAATIADWNLPVIGLEAPDYAEKVDAAARRWMYGRWLEGTTPPF